jgi:hypothetical protein
MNDTVSTQGDAPAQEDVLVDTSGNDELECVMLAPYLAGEILTMTH